jgi:microcystin-dependent protein
MAWYNWSQTASSNATADPSINWAEGQAPSSINDSARAMMAATAKYRDDIAGAILTSGTSTAYTVNSYSVYDSFAHLAGQMIAFTPHATNGAVVTLNVDSLGPRPLRSSPNVELLAGTIIQGTPYVATYNNSDGAFYLQGFVGNPYNVPLAGGMDFWGSTVPNSSFAFPAGQAISRNTYSALFSIMGTTYGTGDGSTTFNLPDKTGRVSAMQEATPTRLTSSYFGGNSTALGATGGTESHTLVLGELPTGITSGNAAQSISVSANNVPYSSTWNGLAPGISTGSLNYPYTFGTISFAGNTLSGTNLISVTSNNTSGNGHRTVQPTIISNYILRII